MVCHAKRVSEEELARASELKTNQEDARLQFDILKAKHKDLLPKSEDPKVRTKFEECEIQRNVAESNFHTYSQQLVTRLNDFDQVRRILHLEVGVALTFGSEKQRRCDCYVAQSYGGSIRASQ
jgi:hypothetical protein